MKKNMKKEKAMDECCDEMASCSEQQSCCTVKCPVTGCWSFKRALSLVLAALGVWCLVNGYMWQNVESWWSLVWYGLGALLLGSCCQGSCKCCQ